MTIINPRKEYWQSRGSKQRPPVLKSAALPTWHYKLNIAEAVKFFSERGREHWLSAFSFFSSMTRKPSPQGLSEPWIVNPLPDNKFQTLPNRKSLQTTISNLTKMAESYPNG